jgi:hypothetical protein
MFSGQRNDIHIRLTSSHSNRVMLDRFLGFAANCVLYSISKDLETKAQGEFGMAELRW